MNPLRVGTDLVEGVVEASVVALTAVEDDLKKADWRPESAPVIVVTSLVQGYWTFLQEVAGSGRHAKDPLEGLSPLERDARIALQALSEGKTDE